MSKQPGRQVCRHAPAARPDVPNRLEREFDVSKPDPVWCGDITCIRAEGCRRYLAVALDLCTRRAVGLGMPSTAHAELAIRVPDMAYEHRGRPVCVLFHTDERSQYASRAPRLRLWRYRMTQSMSRRGNCRDNAPMERLLRSLTSEWDPTLGNARAREAQKDSGYHLMHYCNRWRPHQFNNGPPPAKAEEKLYSLSGGS